jgi:hypothetical protein
MFKLLIFRQYACSGVELQQWFVDSFSEHCTVPFGFAKGLNRIPEVSRYIFVALKLPILLSIILSNDMDCDPLEAELNSTRVFCSLLWQPAWARVPLRHCNMVAAEAAATCGSAAAVCGSNPYKLTKLGNRVF